MGLRIALFGQAAFGKDSLVRLIEQGHEIAGVYAPPAGKRPDPLAEEAEKRGLPLIHHKYFRRKGEAIPQKVDEFLALGAELNVLAFVTAILPPEIVEAPRHGSLCFHPSLLPRFRGGNALAWQIIRGEREAGVTVFQPDAGVDTGPVVVQKGGVEIRDTDTTATLYFDRLYPLGLDALCEAVAAVASGTARYEVQDESQASFQGLVDDTVARIDWSQAAEVLDRLIRGCDPQPGAFAEWKGEPVRCFDGQLLRELAPEAPPGSVVGLREGRLLVAAQGGCLSIGRLRVGAGGKVPAAEAGLGEGDRLS